MAAARDARQSRAWRKLRDQVIAEEPTCRLRITGVCTLVSTTADHILTVAERPDLVMNRANLQGACRPCNQARGNLPIEALTVQPRSEALGIFR